MHFICSATTLTQVRECRSKNLPKPRKRNPVWFVRQKRTVHKHDFNIAFCLSIRISEIYFNLLFHLQIHDDLITEENRKFVTEVLNDRFGVPSLIKGVQTYPKRADESLVAVDKLDVEHGWHSYYSRRCGLIARKIGVVPMWRKDGRKVSTTMLQINDNHVIKYMEPSEFSPAQKPRVKNLKKFGCVLIGAGSADPSLFTKEYCGLFKDSGVMPKRHLGRFLVTPSAKLLPGTPLNVTHFRVGDFVDVRGKT